MKKREDGKVSWLEFLRSINFADRSESVAKTECASHFADFTPHARKEQASDAEDSYVVRSGN